MVASGYITCILNPTLDRIWTTKSLSVGNNRNSCRVIDTNVDSQNITLAMAVSGYTGIVYRCNRQTHSPAPNYTWVWFGIQIIAKLYPGYNLVMLNVLQKIPQVWFDCLLCMPNHTLGTVWLRFMYTKSYRDGIILMYILAVTPADTRSHNGYWQFI